MDHGLRADVDNGGNANAGAQPVMNPLNNDAIIPWARRSPASRTKSFLNGTRRRQIDHVRRGFLGRCLLEKRSQPGHRRKVGADGKPIPKKTLQAAAKKAKQIYEEYEKSHLRPPLSLQQS